MKIEGFLVFFVRIMKIIWTELLTLGKGQNCHVIIYEIHVRVRILKIFHVRVIFGQKMGGRRWHKLYARFE